MQDFNEILINATNEHKIPAPTDAWPFIADALRKRKKRRAAWFFLSFLVMLLLGIGTTFFYNNSNTNKSEANKDVSLKSDDFKKPSNIIEKEIVTNESQALSKVDSLVERNKSIKRNNTILSASTNNNQEIYEKTKIKSKTKSRFKVNIKEASVFVDTEKNIPKEKIIEREIEEKVMENKITKTDKDANSINDSANIVSLKTDTILDKTAKVKTEIEKRIEKLENKKVKIKIEKQNKWKPYIGISYGAIFVSNKNLFQNEDKVAFANPSLLYTTVASTQLATPINNAPNYSTGKGISFSLLFKKENKKFQPQLGLNVNIGNFNAKVYEASNALLDANTFAVDSSRTGNSIYAAKNTLGGSELKIKNNFMQIGLLFGCNIPLYTFKHGNKISLQMQVIPSYYLSQSIQWYDKGSTRYFTSDKLINNFNVSQSAALLWEANIKSSTILIGPYFNFNYLKLNKTVNNISNIYLQTIGAQINFKLKK
jgi:hypothetical protein